MPTYTYQVRNGRGEMQGGTMQADTAQTAAAILRNQGMHVLSLQAKKTSSKGSMLSIGQSTPNQKHVLDFTIQLAVMIRAGINLRMALDGIAEQTKHAGFRKVLMQMKEDVESGKQFSEALVKNEKLFGPLYVNMVRASEMSGSFSAMLDRIATYIAQEMETRKMVVGASIYPGIIGTLAIGVTVFLLTFVLPKFAMVFEGKEDVLPWATNFLMGLSAFITDQWMFIVAILVGIGGVLFAGSKTEVGKFWIDKLKLTVPVFSGMFRALYIARSLQTMGQLINAGVPVLDTLTITGEISGNQIFRGLFRKIHSGVKQGKKITSTLAKDTMLPRAVVQMISAGEESGRLGEVLDEVSGYYHKQLRDHIKAATSMIEPVMILVMGSIVGFIAMAIILPIFKMSQLVQ